MAVSGWFVDIGVCVALHHSPAGTTRSHGRRNRGAVLARVVELAVATAAAGRRSAAFVDAVKARAAEYLMDNNNKLSQATDAVELPLTPLTESAETSATEYMAARAPTALGALTGSLLAK